ncbi:MAG: hypothetical protein AW10_01713 [Candidatus Accumulibacter appositus]|uniref:Uncharacterized protein n=1 Tax=Candidatus Accumulibacter appositus TaxID=1454003 RepID=A0A011PUS4_9PROT|nr:MAG: hypothetical protein AW10_01713 [Candidatus Accumulibacter appositus]
MIGLFIALATPKNERKLHEYVSTWTALTKKEGVVPKLYDYWILGRGATSRKPRWSVIRDVLGWVE